MNGGTIELEAGRQSSENARKYASQLQILLRWPAVAGCVYYKLFEYKIEEATLQRLYNENSKQIFPEMKLCGLVPNSYIHISVSDLCIPTIGLPILFQENR